MQYTDPKLTPLSFPLLIRTVFGHLAQENDLQKSIDR
jgi:hypothetical protein